MKKAFLALAVATGVSAAAHAQVLVGLKAGAGLATYAGTNLEGNSNIITPHGGLTLNAPISSDGFFSIQPELLYSQKGQKLESGNTAFVTRLHYLDLPVLASINADGFVFEGGPQLGFLLNARRERPTGPGETEPFSGTEGLNRVDVGYVAGVGYRPTSGPHVGLRYNGGLSAVLANNSNGGFRNSVFQLFVGYVFAGK